MIRILIFILAGIITPTLAEPGPFSPSLPASAPRIKLDVMTDRESVSPGGRFRLYLSVQIEEGWHIYSLRPLDGNGLLATQITLEDELLEGAGDWQESATRLIQDDAQEKQVKAHTRIAEFHKDFQVPKNFSLGNYSINGKLIYRACDNNLCTLPQSLPFVIHVAVPQE